MRREITRASAVLAVSLSSIGAVVSVHSYAINCNGTPPAVVRPLAGIALALAVLAIALDWRHRTSFAPSSGRSNATLLAILAFPIAGLAIGYTTAYGCGS